MKFWIRLWPKDKSHCLTDCGKLTSANVYVSNCKGKVHLSRCIHRPSPCFACLWVKSSSGLSQLSEFVQLPHRAPESTHSLLCLTATIMQLEPTENTRLQAHDSLQTIILVVQQSFWKLPKKITCLCALFIPEIKQACLKAKPWGFDKGSGYVDVRKKCSIRPETPGLTQQIQSRGKNCTKLPLGKKQT